MPITANSNKIAYGVQEYVFDTKQELDELFISATEKGSTAFIIEEGKTYILNGQMVWVEKLGGGSPSPSIKIIPLTVTENGTYIAPEGQAYSPVMVNVQSGGEMPTTGVIFVDYDGTEVEKWDKDDVAGKTALPDNPSHTGLVAQGWNWTLQSIKDYIAEYENTNVYVGQMYKTTSGLTEIDITVTKATGLEVTCNMVGNKNWGDGTEDNLTEHTYADYGNYTITCDGTSIPAGEDYIGGLFDSIDEDNMNGYWCTAIRIGDRVTSIEEYAFSFCYSLASVTIPNSVTSIETEAFSWCHSLTNIVIPNSITSIETGAFSWCRFLVSIAVPDGVTSIGASAFSNCHSLIGITIPQGVTSLGNGVLFSCSSLTSIAIPDGITSIEDLSFYGCSSLISVAVPDGVTSIGEEAFSICRSLASVTISDNVASIGASAFSDCGSLASITIPDGITSIEDFTFHGCNSLTNIIIPDGVTSIGVLAFSDCSSLTSITIPDGITNIGDSTFADCSSLTSIAIPDSVASIETEAFAGCGSLASITIPDSVVSIGEGAFADCYSLISYDFTSATSVPMLYDEEEYAFAGINGLCKIVVPDALYDDWIVAENWENYADYIYKASEVL